MHGLQCPKGAGGIGVGGRSKGGTRQPVTLELFRQLLGTLLAVCSSPFEVSLASYWLSLEP